METNERTLKAQCIVSHHEFMHIPSNDLMEITKREIVRNIAAELMKSSAITMKEEPDYHTGSKRVTASVTVISEKEYLRLKRIERAAEQAKNTLTNF